MIDVSGLVMRHSRAMRVAVLLMQAGFGAAVVRSLTTALQVMAVASSMHLLGVSLR